VVRAGDVIENPRSGERMEFIKTAEDTGGALLQLVLTVKPGGAVAAPHIHPRQEERFQVRSGTLRLRTNGEERLLRPGQEGVVPAGSPHVWWNEGADELEALVEFRPALRFEDVISTIFALARDGKTDNKGVPNLLQIAVMLRKYPSEIYLARPPIAVQKLLFAAIAWVGPLVGYHADYPYRPAAAKAGAKAAAGTAVTESLGG